jgi:NAD(P)-dependent dehydrogenase (short-subunit alcohol dehydrogenase family)
VVALVTGGASGIGRATALALAGRGDRVVVADIDEAGARGTAEAAGGQASFVRVDTRDRASVQAAVDHTVAAFGRLDYAVNAAGRAGPSHPVLAYPDDAFQDIMAVNATGVLYCMQAEIAQMLRQGGGSIVNMASVAGLRGFPLHVAYAASKFAVIGMTRTAAVELAKANIRVNAVCPAFVDTPMVRGEVGEDAQRLQFLSQYQPIGRMGRPEEIASGILWLLSDAASFVTGSTLTMDGGALA